MSWEATKAEVLNACGALLTPLGYKLVKSRTSFEKATPTGRLAVQLLLISSDVGNQFARIGCGVRHHAIEEIVNMGRAPEKRSSTAWTVSPEWTDPLSLNTPEEQAVTVTRLQEYIREVALPFLERDYSLQDLSALLNVTDNDGRPVERLGMGTQFWQRALAAARLAGDPRFESLRRHYTDRLRTLSNGAYLAEFERCLQHLDERLP